MERMRAPRRRAASARALLALGGVALLSLVLLAAVLLGTALDRRAPSPAPSAPGSTAVATGESDHVVAVVHALHQQPSTRARSTAFAVLALAAIVTPWSSRRLHRGPVGRPRTLRISGLPPGRAPPALRIA